MSAEAFEEAINTSERLERLEILRGETFQLDWLELEWMIVD